MKYFSHCEKSSDTDGGREWHAIVTLDFYDTETTLIGEKSGS